MTTEWIGPVPGFCEICDGPINEVMYDAKTLEGPWACMCEKCFGNGRLGTGYGQEYTKDGDKWHKTGG